MQLFPNIKRVGLLSFLITLFHFANVCSVSSQKGHVIGSVCVCVYVYICVYVCLYVYVYMYLFINIRYYI